MANIKQQKKRIRTAADERLENLRYRSTIKTLTKRLGAAVEDGDADAVADRAPDARPADRQGGLARRAAPERRRAQEVAGGPARLGAARSGARAEGSSAPKAAASASKSKSKASPSPARPDLGRAVSCAAR